MWGRSIPSDGACGDCVPPEQPKTRYHGKTHNTLKQSKTEAVDALEDNVSAAFSFYLKIY